MVQELRKEVRFVSRSLLPLQGGREEGGEGGWKGGSKVGGSVEDMCGPDPDPDLRLVSCFVLNQDGSFPPPETSYRKQCRGCGLRGRTLRDSDSLNSLKPGLTLLKEETFR